MGALWLLESNRNTVGRHFLSSAILALVERTTPRKATLELIKTQVLKEKVSRLIFGIPDFLQLCFTTVTNVCEIVKRLMFVQDGN